MNEMILLASMVLASSSFGPECSDSYAVIKGLENRGYKPLLEGTLNENTENSVRELILANPNTLDYVILHIFDKQFVACVSSFGSKIGAPDPMTFGGKIN